MSSSNSVDFVGFEIPDENQLPSDEPEAERFFRHQIRRIDEDNVPSCWDCFKRGFVTAVYGVTAVAGIVIRAVNPWKAVSSPLGETLIDLGIGAGAQLCCQSTLSPERVRDVKRTELTYATQAFFIGTELYLNLPDGTPAKIVISTMRVLTGVAFTSSVHSIFHRSLVGSEADELTRPLAADSARKIQVYGKYNSKTSIVLKVIQAAASVTSLGLGYAFPSYRILTTLGYIYGFDVVAKVLVDFLYSKLSKEERRKKHSAFSDTLANADFVDAHSEIPRSLRYSLTVTKVLLTCAPFLSGAAIATHHPVGDVAAGLLFGLMKETRSIVYTESDPASLHLSRQIEPITNNPCVLKVWNAAKWTIAAGASTFCIVGIVQGPYNIDRYALGTSLFGLSYGYLSSRWVRSRFKPNQNGALVNTAYYRKQFAQIPPVFAIAVIDNMKFGDRSLNQSPKDIFRGLMACGAYFDLTSAIGEESARKESLPPMLTPFGSFVLSHFATASIKGKIN